MKPVVLGILIGAFGTTLGCGGSESTSPGMNVGDPRTPVLVELFTSEGCSSCPPADQLLGRLMEEQPLPDVYVIGLAVHIDYWNGIGWSDRFASEAFTERQFAYQAAAFPTSVVYTPQAVVDGSFECIGSDLPALQRAVERAARSPKASVRVSTAGADTHAVPVTVDVDIPPSIRRDGPSDVLLALVEDDLASQVSGGENRGRTLSHQAVVRALNVVGQLAVDQSVGSFSTRVDIADGWRPEHLRVVAFVQDTANRKVIGVADAIAR